MRIARALVALALAIGLAAPAAADTVSLPDGGTLAYTKAGSGGRALILVHGYSMAKEVWDKVIPEVADGWTVYAYDLRGFGDSTKPGSGYDYPAMVADLAGFMDALRIESAVVAGHSLGGIFAQDFAVAHPERVDALVLANVQARDKPPLGMTDAFRARIDAWGDVETNRAIFEKTTPVYFMKGTDPAALAPILAMNEKAATAALKQSFEHLLTAEPIPAEAFARIEMPVLVIASSHDIVPFSVVAGLLDSLPQAELAVIARSGHTPMWERPEAFAAVLNAFLAGL